MNAIGFTMALLVVAGILGYVTWDWWQWGLLIPSVIVFGGN